MHTRDFHIVPNLVKNPHSMSKKAKSRQFAPHPTVSEQILPWVAEYCQVISNLATSGRLLRNMAKSWQNVPDLVKSRHIASKSRQIPPILTQDWEVAPNRAKSPTSRQILACSVIPLQIVPDIGKHRKSCQILTWSGFAISYQTVKPGQI